MVWGPDDHLWVTERQGKTITRVHPQNGSKQLVATLDEAFVGPQHEGLLGLALAPDFLQRGSRNALYVAYTYKTGEHEYAKIVRLQYDPATQTASKAHTVIDKLPGSSDHNAIYLPGSMLLLSSFLAALAYMQVKSLGEAGEPEQRTVFYVSIGTALMGLLGTCIFQGGFTMPDWRTAWLLPAVGIFASLGQWCLTSPP